MIKSSKHKTYCIKKGGAEYSFSATGDIVEFSSGNSRINCFEGTPAEISISNLWLRLYHNNQIAGVYPLWGGSGAELLQGENCLSRVGNAGGVNYTLTFFACENSSWIWHLSLSDFDGECDVLYGQDIGVADQNSIRDNELYMAQYLGHSIFTNEHGYVVCSRQNQPQHKGMFPYLQQGMLLGKAESFCTDATQFFGLSYKGTNRPKALWGALASQNRQFELAYTGLQTEKINLAKGAGFAFYGLFRENCPNAVGAPVPVEELSRQLSEFLSCSGKLQPCATAQRKPEFGAVFSAREFTLEEINQLWPERRLEEWSPEGNLLSFFLKDHTHVVLKAKELICERPHGHIITTRASTHRVNNNLLTSTNYIFGLFNAQTVIGNTTAHKLISASRGLLNQFKNHGQRLWVKLEGEWRLLTLPAAYELGMNWAKWHYPLPSGQWLTVRVYAAASFPALVLEVRASQKYDYLLTTQLVMGAQEFIHPLALEQQKNTLIFRPAPKNLVGHPYPGLHYTLTMEQTPFTVSDDRVFFTDEQPRNETLLTCQMQSCDGFRFVLQGSLEETKQERIAGSFQQEKAKYHEFYKEITGNLQLSLPGAEKSTVLQLEKLNTTVWWYAHNALVHFAAPHGLEQPGGAAWGTRDICQGPFEFFMATGHTELVRDILLHVYSHQQEKTGEWPQWFMFDRYTANAGECHGDVVFWPLKCIAEYLLATRDYSILQQEVPWLDDAKPAPLANHVKKAAAQYRQRFLEGTSLLSYAGGDWDDTLQPADELLRQGMVSAWTQALGYQTACLLYDAFKKCDPAFATEMRDISVGMKADFNQHLLLDGVIAGFVRQLPGGEFSPMLHPKDNTTGIHLRLLPHTRSILGGLVSYEQAQNNLELIQNKLACPDGVRLMDHPAQYNGGVSKLFRRAEQAANVGREVGLQYVHAHIRTIEALAKAGCSQRAWEYLFIINPILIKQAVPNALPRQSNLYFSSSDPAFLDRYQFQQEFHKVFSGEVGVLGGWRLYSSGPGLYFSELVQTLLGLRLERDGLVINPSLPQSLDGLTVDFIIQGQQCRFTYHIAQTPQTPRLVFKGKQLESTLVENVYRQPGIRVSTENSPLLSGEYEIYI